MPLGLADAEAVSEAVPELDAVPTAEGVDKGDPEGVGEKDPLDEPTEVSVRLSDADRELELVLEDDAVLAPDADELEVISGDELEAPVGDNAAVWESTGVVVLEPVDVGVLLSVADPVELRLPRGVKVDTAEAEGSAV